MEVKGRLKRNRWHFCENIGTVWNGVRPALRCLDITCLCVLSFLLKDFSQTEQNQLVSTPQEQNVDWERGRMLSIYIGFQAIKFQCFLPPPPPPPPHFYCFPSTTTTTTTAATTFLSSLSSFSSNVSCSEQQSWFSSTVSWLPCLSAPVSFKDSYSTATTFTSPSLIQYNWNTFPFPKKISGYCCHIRTLYLTWPDRMSLTKQRSESLYKRVVVLLKMY